MKATLTKKETITTLDLDTAPAYPQIYRHRSPAPTNRNTEQQLTELILQNGKGKSLLKYCRELSVMLVRSYLVEDDAEELRNNLCEGMLMTLACTEHQAQCLVDLALELIHVKVHSEYRRSNVDLSYLVAMATAALECDPIVA